MIPSARDVYNRPEVYRLVVRLCDVLHQAGIEPSEELSVALLYLGTMVALTVDKERQDATE